jgi:hypothetical protein
MKVKTKVKAGACDIANRCETLLVGRRASR